MAYEYKLSGYTDDAFAAYSSYLKSRIDSLRTSGSIASASKALTLTSTLDSAMRSNVSATISRATDAIMQGTATPQDKYNLIVNQYMRALDNGDETLAQSLASRADSLSQTIQQQDQTAHDNAIAYARAQGASQDSVATQLETGLRNLNADIAAGGMAKFNAAAKDWVAANKDKLLALADSPSATPDIKAAIEKAVNTSQPGYQDIVAGITNAMISAHITAANSLINVNDPNAQKEAQTYYQQANDLANGKTKISTLAGDLTAQDVMTWQQQPGMFIPHENTTGGQLSFSFKSAGLQNGESAISGYQFDQNGNLVPVFTGSENGFVVKDQATADNINNQLAKTGLSFKKVSVGENLSNGISVQFNKVNQDGVQLPKWLTDTTFGQKNLTTQVYVTPQGLQFGTLDSSGKAHGFLIARDNNGLNALYTGENVNGQLTFRQQNAQGDYGFNQNQNSVVNMGTNTSAPATNTFLNQTVNMTRTNGINNQSTTALGALGVKPSMAQRQGGGYNFTDANGNAISAATYARMTNTPFRTLLQQMASSGDVGAKTALGFVGNDFGYDPTKAASYQNAGVYNSLTWGAGVKAAPTNAPASVLGNGASLTY